MDPTQRPAAARVAAVHAVAVPRPALTVPAQPLPTLTVVPAQPLPALTVVPAQPLPALTVPGLTVLALVLATLTLTAALLLVAAPPARAADVFVQVNPSTVEAGFLVGLKASCTDNTLPATVESPAFGTITVQPQGGQLTAAAMVPAQTRAGSYRVRLECPDGRNASTTLMVVNAKRPTRGPATGFGGAAGGDDMGGLLVGGGLAVTAFGTILGVLALRRRVGLAGGTTTRRRTRS